MLYESVKQKMAKIYVHELSSFGPPNLERYPFMGRDDNSLNEIELEEKNNWVSDRKMHQDLIKRDTVILLTRKNLPCLS